MTGQFMGHPEISTELMNSERNNDKIHSVNICNLAYRNSVGLGKNSIVYLVCKASLGI